MRLFAIIALTFAVLGQASAEEIYCDIASLRDAEACMKKWAEAYPEYEEPNDALVSDNVGLVTQLMKELEMPKYVIRRAEKSAYVGAMVVHEDEHHIIYYSFQKGKGVSPKEIYDLNTADIAFILGDSIRENEEAFAAQPTNYFLGLDAQKYDALQLVEEQIAMALAGH